MRGYTPAALFVIGSSLLWGSNAFSEEILLTSLECKNTEDWTGADELELEVWIDGSLQTTLDKSLNDGEAWSLNFSVIFSDNVKLKLFDVDSGRNDPSDSDDLLGTVEIRSSAGGSGSFTQDGANYQLNWR